MQTVEAFKTSDGTLFDNKLQAERHELFLKKEMVVEEFLDSDLNPYKGHAHRSMARATVVNWELWKVKNAE
jgi:hypothetical protein